MKNLKQSITFWDCMIRLCPVTLSIPIWNSNLCSVHLSSDIPHNIVDNFSIYSSELQYEKFLVMSFINRLERNLPILRFVVSNSAK